VERDEPGKGGNRVVSILVSVPVAKLVLVPRDAFEDGRVTLYVGARDDAGNLSPIHRVEVPLHIPRARLAAGAAAAGYVVKLALSPAEQTVAVTLRDELGRAESTATAPYRPAAAVSAAKR
jgi:hypothetical protein